MDEQKVVVSAACSHCGEIFFPEHETFCSRCGRIAEDSGDDPEYPVDDELLEPYNDERHYPEV